MKTTSLNKKNKDSFHKLPKCEVKHHGDEKDERRADLIRVAREVKQWCKNERVNQNEMFNVGMSDALTEAAKSVIHVPQHRLKTLNVSLENYMQDVQCNLKHFKDRVIWRNSDINEKRHTQHVLGPNGAIYECIHPWQRDQSLTRWRNKGITLISARIFLMLS